MKCANSLGTIDSMVVISYRVLDSRPGRRHMARRLYPNANARQWWTVCIGPWVYFAWVDRNTRVRFFLGGLAFDFGNYHIDMRLVQALNPPSIVCQ